MYDPKTRPLTEIARDLGVAAENLRARGPRSPLERGTYEAALRDLALEFADANAWIDAQERVIALERAAEARLGRAGTSSLAERLRAADRVRREELLESRDPNAFR